MTTGNAEHLTGQVSQGYVIESGDMKELRDENIRLKVKLQMADQQFKEITEICNHMQMLVEKLK